MKAKLVESEDTLKRKTDPWPKEFKITVVNTEMKSGIK